MSPLPSRYVTFTQDRPDVWSLHFNRNGAYLGEAVADDSGDFMFWPAMKRRTGCWPAYVLADIAQGLDDLNARHAAPETTP